VPLEGDRAFHLAVVNACGNAVLTETVQNFWDSRQRPDLHAPGRLLREPFLPGRLGHFDEHEAILDAVAARDAEGARAAMHAHMDKSHQRFSASWRRAKPS
jgi:DNA-binding GntR family transcriptional regulator